MTHFACADSTDTVSLDHQLQAFAAATREFRGSPAVVRHAANSAALFRSERAHLDAVRPGIALFGVAPCAGCVPELRPVMRLLTEIVALRTIEEGGAVGYGATWRARRASRIATIPLGYADGLSRSLSSAGQVLVRGRRAPIVGTISMDLTMVDVTDVPGAMLRDEVVTLGAQHGPLGSDEISAAEMATLRGTIPWEVFTNVSRRVPRVHIE
jgi:alanine racemase